METMRLPKCRQLVGPEAMDRLRGARIVSQEEVDGAVRLRIVLSKKELKKMVGSLPGPGPCPGAPGQRQRQSTGHDQSFEQMLHVLRKRHMRRVAAAAAAKEVDQYLPEWQPALQSIPEEIESYRIEESS